MAAQPLRGAIAQNIGNSPPAERNAGIRERKLHRTEAALESIIADAQIELAHALLVQRRHRSLDDEPARGTVRPARSRVADAQECEIISLSHPEHRRNRCLVTSQRRNDRLAALESPGDKAA